MLMMMQAAPAGQAGGTADLLLGIAPWLLTIDHGSIEVSRSDAPADAVLRTDRAFFERMLTGEANPFTAALRGRLRTDGDVRLILAFKSVLPGPPRHRTEIPVPAGAAAEPTEASTPKQ